MTDYYETNAADPDAPVALGKFDDLRIGMPVVYVGTFPLDVPLVLTALYRFTPSDHETYVSAILNGGEYEVDALNLHTVSRVCCDCGEMFVAQTAHQRRCAYDNAAKYMT